MTPQEQHEVLSAITVALVEVLPPGWQRMVVEYTEDGGVGSGVRMMDGSHVHVPVPESVRPQFRRLREGDNWHQLKLVIDPPARFQVRYDR